MDSRLRGKDGGDLGSESFGDAAISSFPATLFAPKRVAGRMKRVRKVKEMMAADDDGGERALRLAARPDVEGHRNGAQACDEGRHEEGSEAPDGTLADRLRKGGARRSILLMKKTMTTPFKMATALSRPAETRRAAVSLKSAAVFRSSSAAARFASAAWASV